MSGHKYDTTPESPDYTEREIQFLQLWMRGLSYAEIAEQMDIRENTVKTFVTRTKNRAVAAKKTVNYYETCAEFREDNMEARKGGDN